ncbi:hypothetical protein HTY61_14965 [Oricola thermophila]|uniref:Uncharacterized protein n=1 Tax=Oricola thermophila TaxID=2742145 RepID=A0A6N1VJS8_9HYPH|nr:hypothetical protein HTY61_14965 [Oricola thermophila]
MTQPSQLRDVHLPTLPAQQHTHPAKAVTNTGFANLLDPSFEAGLSDAAASVLVSRGVEPKNPAGLAFRQISAAGVRASPCPRINAFRASLNFDAFVRFRSSPRQ